MKARSLGDRKWRVDETADAIVELDPQRLTQAMLNLARNAVEHTGPGTSVTIGSRVTDGRVQLWVRDDGPGIAPTDHERIFERFARGRHSRRRSDGAGLGLAIVAAVAEGHGGHVVLESEPGEGATFTLDLPMARPVDADEPPTTNTEGPEWPGS
jgi:signal transduction histidine kinase